MQSQSKRLLRYVNTRSCKTQKKEMPIFTHCCSVPLVEGVIIWSVIDILGRGLVIVHLIVNKKITTGYYYEEDYAGKRIQKDLLIDS